MRLDICARLCYFATGDRSKSAGRRRTSRGGGSGAKRAKADHQVLFDVGPVYR